MFRIEGEACRRPSWIIYPLNKTLAHWYTPTQDLLFSFCLIGFPPPSFAFSSFSVFQSYQHIHTPNHLDNYRRLLILPWELLAVYGPDTALWKKQFGTVMKEQEKQTIKCFSTWCRYHRALYLEVNGQLIYFSINEYCSRATVMTGICNIVSFF